MRMNLYQAKVAVSNEVTLSGFERLANLGGEKLECDDLHFSHFLLFAPPLFLEAFSLSPYLPKTFSSFVTYIQPTNTFCKSTSN